VSNCSITLEHSFEMLKLLVWFCYWMRQEEYCFYLLLASLFSPADRKLVFTSWPKISYGVVASLFSPADRKLVFTSWPQVCFHQLTEDFLWDCGHVGMPVICMPVCSGLEALPCIVNTLGYWQPIQLLQ